MKLLLFGLPKSHLSNSTNKRLYGGVVLRCILRHCPQNVFDPSITLFGSQTPNGWKSIQGEDKMGLEGCVDCRK